MNPVRDKKLKLSADSLKANWISNGVKRTFAYLVPLFFPFVALSATLDNPLGFDTLYEFLVAILDVVIAIAFPALILFFVWIGFKFLMAQGDPKELQQARQYFLWAIVGALLVLGARVLAEAIRETVRQLGVGA